MYAYRMFFTTPNKEKNQWKYGKAFTLYAEGAHIHFHVYDFMCFSLAFQCICFIISHFPSPCTMCKCGGFAKQHRSLAID